MPLRHVLLAVSVAAMWGFNFIAIDASLDTYPPLLLAAIRFGLIAVPTLLLIPRPRVPWRWLIAYGVGFGVLQFGFLYWGMAEGMPAGLASLVLQASAPFTVMLGAFLLRERLTVLRAVGILIAVLGLAVVGWQRAEHATVLPFLLTLAGALGWAIGNIGNRQARAADPFHLMLWMTVIPPLPFLLLSLIFEGPRVIGDAVRTAVTLDGLMPTLGLLYTVVIATLAGSGIWTWLMSRHPAGVVAPFSMLVPVVGMSSAWLVLAEVVRPGEILGGVLVFAGVLIGTVTGKTGSRRRAMQVPTARPPADVDPVRARP
ncbi:O-acetylserine/cysteine efflux transporter [Stackebrandtia endophytica]|uniref:O-acetylserine/cysteine efflux transporter n=1 Tax=Stackebrandtia endophytica TaxID=1496996 RepID=A0A543AY33_9ACTN|nr:EamA family transporter [Stackebrandtia endophytica]TQL77483.1 O-acetylserine/cysteine efflux transporter [Stackebrandtia endophytica]